MDYFVFKINLQPGILNAFIEQEGNIDFLKEKGIPNAFENIMSVNELENGYYQFEEIKPDIKGLHDKFQKLEIQTEKLRAEYEIILQNYRDGKGINYDPNFIALNKECGKKRSALEKEYSILNDANSVSDEFIVKKYNLDFDNQVGTGIKHINKFYKLKNYMDQNENEIIAQQAEYIYNTKTEHLLIKTESSIFAIRYALDLEKK